MNILKYLRIVKYNSIQQNLFNFIHSHFNKQHLIIYILSIYVMNKKLKT